MTLTLTLTPEKERRLQEQARLAGMPLDDYLLWIGNQLAGPMQLPREEQAETAEQKAARFLRWADSHDPATPPLPPEAVTREALYAEEAEDPL